jgi:hypothetical protein
MNIDKYFVLNKYFLNLFGFQDIKDAKRNIRQENYEVDPNTGLTNFYSEISTLPNLKVEIESLEQYDRNIISYVEKINRTREPKVNLKYFQYLAILFTEIYFDKIKKNKSVFLSELNDFKKHYSKEAEVEIDDFEEKDLNGLAFSMATGSGKTIISHINFLQFLRYEPFRPDHILYITPNSGLSRQHFDELLKSGITAKLYEGALSKSQSENEILVIEITKLKKDKQGGGVSLPVDAFEGRNLIFVDEGHKGNAREEQEWGKIRSILAKDGFEFEYSATFHQILSEKNKSTLQSYSKSIIFDYSYKYFYLDGYGKDFSVFNVKEVNRINEDVYEETVFVANLLSYFEQLLSYNENPNVVRENNIEKPLWIFVGTTVNKEDEALQSDILKIVQFFKKVIEDESWLKKKIEDILIGNTPFKEDGNDILKNKFVHIKDKDIDSILDSIYKTIFGGNGKLSIYEIKSADGELGLQVVDGKYFGVVNIGELSNFKKKLEKVGIEILSDAITPSLFDDIKKENSSINVLIGAKKFIEGWDTWRITSMGLLNIGKSQGPQIIQLFGRGVRLKGKNMSLKRSDEFYSNPALKKLETLEIYGIKANYINKFIEEISKEIDIEPIKIPVEFSHKDKWDEIFVPIKDEVKFNEQEVVKLDVDEHLPVSLDLRPKIVSSLGERRKESEETNLVKNATLEGETKNFCYSELGDKIDLLNWQKIYAKIEEFRLERKYFNLIFDIDSLKNVLLSDKCLIETYEDLGNINSLSDMERLEDLAIELLKKYIYRFYRKIQSQAEIKAMKLKPIKTQEKRLKLPFLKDGNEAYVVSIDRKENKETAEKIKAGLKNAISSVQKIAKELDKIGYGIYLDEHLFIPIIVQNKDIESTEPQGLVKSEKDFLDKIKQYIPNLESKGFEIYLLRNLPSYGFSFTLDTGEDFHPDFLMWVKKNGKEAIIFIEPHGLLHSGENDPKMNFRDKIKDIEKSISKQGVGLDVVLDYFIISETSWRDFVENKSPSTTKSYYKEKHVYFKSDSDWVSDMFDEIIKIF